MPVLSNINKQNAKLRVKSGIHSFETKAWIQTMVSSAEPELFAAEMFPRFLPEFIKLMFETNQMEDELLDAWDYYTVTSDYEKKSRVLSLICKAWMFVKRLLCCFEGELLCEKTFRTFQSRGM